MLLSRASSLVVIGRYSKWRVVREMCISDERESDHEPILKSLIHINRNHRNSDKDSDNVVLRNNASRHDLYTVLCVCAFSTPARPRSRLFILARE